MLALRARAVLARSLSTTPARSLSCSLVRKNGQQPNGTATGDANADLPTAGTVEQPAKTSSPDQASTQMDLKDLPPGIQREMISTMAALKNFMGEQGLRDLLQYGEDQIAAGNADLIRPASNAEQEFEEFDHDQLWDPPTSLENLYDLRNLDPDEGDDSTSVGHTILDHQRQLLHYMRLIEGDMVNLYQYRKTFVPPTNERPLIVRTLSYGNEQHPVTRKRVVTVPVASLPLHTAAALHKFKLLAGVRWTPDPPRDGGLGQDDQNGEHGFVKISCEDFPEPAQNLKWISDVLDEMLREANKPDDTMQDIPIDDRHITARFAKRKGYNKFGHRPSIRDFPKEWLPSPA